MFTIATGCVLLHVFIGVPYTSLLLVLFQQLYQTFTDFDIRFYLYEIIKVGCSVDSHCSPRAVCGTCYSFIGSLAVLTFILHLCRLQQGWNSAAVVVQFGCCVCVGICALCCLNVV